MRPPRILIMALGAAAFLAEPGAAQPADGSQEPGAAQDTGAVQGAGAPLGAATARDPRDSEFLMDAIRMSIAEVQLGTLAEQRAHDERVRAYGRRLRTDHSRTMEETAALLETTVEEIPSEPDAEAQARYQALAMLSGPEFDAAFVDHMIAAHREAIEAYGRQTHANPNEALADLAEKTLATLREHLAIAESLKARVAATSLSDSHLRVEAGSDRGRNMASVGGASLGSVVTAPPR